jgi:hypothetical protein
MAESPRVIGWREWVRMPLLQTQPFKAKIDSGAKTCALHACYVEPFERDGAPWVRFGVRPHRRRPEIVHCETPLIDRREVSDSGGHRALRCVIAADLVIGDELIRAEVTLADRAPLQYRMLIGRNALGGRFLIDSARSFALGRPPR